MKRRLKPHTKMGEAFINYIEAHDMDMQSFASKSGLSYPSVNQWIVGRSTKAGRIKDCPSFKQLVKIEEQFPDLVVALLEAGV